jgi:hypothetical protein
MFANALIISVCFMLALLFYLMGELKYLIPYRDMIWQHYAWPISVYAMVLFLNLYAASYLFMRKLFLKDTGKKLRQIDRQLRIEHARLTQIHDDEAT